MYSSSAALNRAGAEGWEAVGIFANDMILLKREYFKEA
jgi:hypothetical protein